MPSTTAVIDRAVLYPWSTAGMLQSELGRDPSGGIFLGSLARYQ